jgi:hypothetical protein
VKHRKIFCVATFVSTQFRRKNTQSLRRAERREGFMMARRFALSNSCNGGGVPQPLRSESRDARMFQIVRLALDDNDEVAARRALQPLFELWEDAVAMAEFDASRLWGDYGWDEDRNCWWATDSRGARYRLAVEAVAPAEVAA